MNLKESVSDEKKEICSYCTGGLKIYFYILIEEHLRGSDLRMKYFQPTYIYFWRLPPQVTDQYIVGNEREIWTSRESYNR